MRIERLKNKNLPVITSSKILYNNKFTKDGLFSEYIFGTVKNMRCSCADPDVHNMVCNKCGCELTKASERRKRYAKIVLPFKIFNPFFLDFIQTKYRIIIRKLLSYSSYGILDDGEMKFTKVNDFVVDNIPENAYFGIDGARKYLQELVDENPSVIYKFEYFDNKISNMLTDEVIVIPPDFRPIIPSIDETTGDSLNIFYKRILSSIELFNSPMNVALGLDSFRYKVERSIQHNVSLLQKEIFKVKLGSKNGLLRNNMLGKRIDFSGRSVIVPDINIRLDQVRVPYAILMNIFKFKVVHKVMVQTKNPFEHTIIEKIDNAILKGERIYVDILEELIKDNVVLLNRQPTLHRHNLLAFYPLLSDDDTIKIHPLITFPYNADFDGDQMAVYGVLGKKAQKEAKELLLSTKNLWMDASGELAFRPNHEMMLGLFLRKKQKLPNGFSNVKEILNYVKTIPETNIPTILDSMKDDGFKESMKSGFTFSLSSMAKSQHVFDKSKVYVGENLKIDIDSEQQEIERMKENSIYRDVIDCGARGSWDQYKQVFMAKGYMTTCTGKTVPTPIKNSLLDGLTPLDIFLAAYGVRKGLADVSDNTAVSGAFERDLIFAGSFILAGEHDDCKTDKTFPIMITEENYSRLAGRYYMEDGKAKQLTHKNIGQIVNIRSPLTCKNKEFCKICYPTNLKNVGIIAAQVLGERSTQMVLRTFHVSGNISKVSKGESREVVNDLIEIKDYLSGKKKIDNVQNLISDLDFHYSSYGKINWIHFETIVSELMKDPKGNLHRLSADPAYKIVSYRKIPAQSVLVSMSHSHLKANLKKGFYEPIKETNFDSILLGRI